MFEEDIFGDDTLKLVLRYGDYTINGFDKKSVLMSFDKMLSILNGKEKVCSFSRKDDRRHIVTIPISEDGFSGTVQLFIEWHATSYSYEVKANKECKSRFVSETIVVEPKYFIEQRCQIIFLGLQDPFNDFTAIEALHNLKERVAQLEIAPATIIENERQLWTKYIDAQRIIVDKLQEPFLCKGKCRLEAITGKNKKITRYKLFVPLENSQDNSSNAFSDLLEDYSATFEEKISIEQDGTALLTKEELERVDIMIQRKFGEILGRRNTISCMIKIAPRNVRDMLKADLKAMGIDYSVEIDWDQKLLFISDRRKIVAKIPRALLDKYGLRPTGVFCKYTKIDEFNNKFYDVEKKKIFSPNLYNLEVSSEKVFKAASAKKQKLETEDYTRVYLQVGQTYSFIETDSEFNDDFWKSLKTDFYGLNISILPNDNLLFFDFTSFEALEEKLDLLERNDKFKLVRTNSNKMKYKVRFYPIEKRTSIDTFEYKKEKLTNVEFITLINKNKRWEKVYIGNLIGRESSEKVLTFSIPYMWSDDKKKAKEIIKLFGDNDFNLEFVQANLRGDEVKLSWLDDAIKKLDEKRRDSLEPNMKPVNSRFRDFIFDSSKAQPTYKFEVDDSEIEELNEYRELQNRQLLHLNKSQKLAVLKALYAKDLCLLQGPPGTGKTTVIAELIWQHIMQDSTKKILLTSETNLAVDNAFEKLMGARNINPILSPFLSIIKPLRFGRSAKFDEEGKKYSVERIEKWLDEEYEEDFVYENEVSSLENAEDEILEDQEIEEDVNYNAIQQWMSMIARRASEYGEKNPKYKQLTDSYCASLFNPDGITKRFFKEMYFKHANVIGSTCSSTGSPSFAADYARVFSYAIFDKYVAKEGYEQTISDIKRLIRTANDFDDDFQNTAKSIIRTIIKENNVKDEDELRELLDNPTDNLKHFLFNYDLRRLLKPRRIRNFDIILERLGFENEDELNQLKSIYFDVVIMDEASKATPPDLVLPLCFGKTSIVIGDHRQLPPMLNEQDFKEALLSLNDEKAKALANEIDREFIETSQFARLILNPRISKSIKSIFTEQYRMHPQINDVIKQFYKDDEGGLICGLDSLKVNEANLFEPESRYHGFHHPGFISPDVHVLWVKVDEPEQRSDSKALYNDKEVEAVKRVLQYLIHSDGFKEYLQFWDNNVRSEERRNQEKEIGIISFYAYQVKCLKEVKAFAKKNNIRVRLNTVDKFQGMERNIVIVSTVRSNKYKSGLSIKPNNNPGFAKSPERLNVALSRARRLLIVVGNNDFFNQVKDRNGNLLYHNVIEEMQKHHEIIDYKTLTKYTK